MPTYDYECKNCGHIFEYFQSMADEPLTNCPDCHKESLRRLVGGGMGVIFKGSGFYVNDAKKSSSTSQPIKEKNSSEKPAAAESSGSKKTSQTA